MHFRPVLSRQHHLPAVWEDAGARHGVPEWLGGGWLARAPGQLSACPRDPQQPSCGSNFLRAEFKSLFFSDSLVLALLLLVAGRQRMGMYLITGIRKSLPAWRVGRGPPSCQVSVWTSPDSLQV